MLLVDHEGGTVDLDDLTGIAHALVLLPGAFTPVCTQELPAIDALWREAGERGVPVLTVACDAPAVLAAWRQAKGVQLPLLSDFWPHGGLARSLGAFDEVAGRCRRTSLVIGADGGALWRDDAEAGAVRDLDGLARVLADL